MSFPAIAAFSPKASSALRLSARGSAPTGEPSGPTSMSKRISRAGVSCDKRRIRLAAGCSRACSASKVMRPFSSMTSSPSTTNRSNGASCSVATTSGKKRLKEVPDFPLSSTAPPSLKAKQRNPSHFGSNCHSPGSFGSDSADLASIGAAPCRKECRSGSSTPGVLRALIHEPLLSSPSRICLLTLVFASARRCRSTSAGSLGSKSDVSPAAAGRLSGARRRAVPPAGHLAPEHCQLSGVFSAA